MTNADLILQDVDVMLNEMLALLDRQVNKPGNARYLQGYMDAVEYMLIARNAQAVKATEKGTKDAHLLAFQADERLRK